MANLCKISAKEILDFGFWIPHSADTKANLGIKNLEKVKPEKIVWQRFQAFIW
jgi:hypothetical protein